jgi:PleD family two-component response regulator
MWAKTEEDVHGVAEISASTQTGRFWAGAPGDAADQPITTVMALAQSKPVDDLFHYNSKNLHNNQTSGKLGAVMKNILVVDDEPKITQLVRDYLERAGFGVLVAYDGKKALSLAKTEKPDMVVLDLGLPQLDGMDYLQSSAGPTPIIMLTARAENQIS